MHLPIRLLVSESHRGLKAAVADSCELSLFAVE